jgi:hypothetical protein
MKHAKVSQEERQRRADSALRVIRESPGLTAWQIGRRMGEVTARDVRERIRLLRKGGVAIVALKAGGYVYLPDTLDDARRAEFVRDHRWRTREYMLDHAVLMKQIGGMAADAVAEACLFDLTVPLEECEKVERNLLGPDDLARLPEARRGGWTKVLVRMLDRLAADPEAWATERAAIASRFGGVFITAPERAKLAQAKKLLAEIGV